MQAGVRADFACSPFIDLFIFAPQPEAWVGSSLKIYMERSRCRALPHVSIRRLCHYHTYQSDIVTVPDPFEPVSSFSAPPFFQSMALLSSLPSPPCDYASFSRHAILFLPTFHLCSLTLTLVRHQLPTEMCSRACRALSGSCEIIMVMESQLGFNLQNHAW